ncbi:TetR/AcrR family transcriptional regulator [Agrobacterium sp. RAC06]|uniref:TetR/AcrR family transcriptional regulator n=1 Tax=Agrobacterium sp. RAC06 TaxID=1842536 RepID=UPI00083D54D5|nr:TetR/AcrR family transcriptional regulator [Agrobacterium sp. RAC06]AOG12514.1 bacterial regulatory s, tetR family protein [Agrobacterium sp. RAC06]
MAERNTAEEPARTRDRQATEARILEAAQSILIAAGPSGFGVNAVAREAGIDKQLIYRYYGGMDGLLEALGIRLAEWWQEKLMAGLPEKPAASYGELIELLALRLLAIMRTEPLALQTLLWELTGSESFVKSLSASRARAYGTWMARVRGNLAPPEDVDAPAVNALLIAAISQITLAGRNADTIIGLPANDASTWDRVEQSIIRLIRGVYPLA